MKKFEVIVSPTAQIQYSKIIQYLREEWPDSVRIEFEKLVREKIGQVALFPKSCKESRKKKGIYKAVIEKHNSFLYRIRSNRIEILAFFDNRIDPSKELGSLTD